LCLDGAAAVARPDARSKIIAHRWIQNINQVAKPTACAALTSLIAARYGVVPVKSSQRMRVRACALIKQKVSGAYEQS